jgi:hypothetical protein
LSKNPFEALSISVLPEDHPKLLAMRKEYFKTDNNYCTGYLDRLIGFRCYEGERINRGSDYNQGWLDANGDMEEIL